MSKKSKSATVAIFSAIQRRDIDAVKKCLSEGLDPNVAHDDDYIKNLTPLMMAAEVQFGDAVEVLLAAGADPNVRTVKGAGAHGGTTALHYAIYGANTSL